MGVHTSDDLDALRADSEVELIRKSPHACAAHLRELLWRVIDALQQRLQ